MADPKGAADANKRAQQRRQRRHERELIAAYQQAWKRIKADLDALIARVAAEQQAGRSVSRALLAHQDRLQGLLVQVTAELAVVAHASARTITEQQADAVLAGRIHAEELIAHTLGPPPAGATAFQPVFPTEAFRQLVATATDGGPLAQLLDELPPQAATDVKRALITGLSQGKGPRKVAREVRDALGGNMARALTISRTEILRAYRGATIDTYRANRDVVDGWVWNAALDRRTCAMCVAMHGTEHPLDETLDSHPACRCTMIPKTKTWRDLGFDVSERQAPLESGEEWFARQDEALQRQVLGPGKLAAYRSGRIGLPDLVQVTHSARWGRGRRERSLRDALTL